MFRLIFYSSYYIQLNCEHKTINLILFYKICEIHKLKYAIDLKIQYRHYFMHTSRNYRYAVAGQEVFLLLLVYLQTGL